MHVAADDSSVTMENRATLGDRTDSTLGYTTAARTHRSINQSTSLSASTGCDWSHGGEYTHYQGFFVRSPSSSHSGRGIGKSFSGCRCTCLAWVTSEWHGQSRGTAVTKVVAESLDLVEGIGLHCAIGEAECRAERRVRGQRVQR